MRAEATDYNMNSPPYLSIWKENMDVTDQLIYQKIHLINVPDNASFTAGERDHSDIFYYTLHRPLSVEAGDIIGLELPHRGNESHRVVFLDSREENPPVSYYQRSNLPLLTVPPVHGSNTSGYTLLVGVQFGKQ